MQSSSRKMPGYAKSQHGGTNPAARRGSLYSHPGAAPSVRADGGVNHNHWVANDSRNRSSVSTGKCALEGPHYPPHASAVGECVTSGPIAADSAAMHPGKATSKEMMAHKRGWSTRQGAHKASAPHHTLHAPAGAAGCRGITPPLPRVDGSETDDAFGRGAIWRKPSGDLCNEEEGAEYGDKESLSSESEAQASHAPSTASTVVGASELILLDRARRHLLALLPLLPVPVVKSACASAAGHDEDTDVGLLRRCMVCGGIGPG